MVKNRIVKYYPLKQNDEDELRRAKIKGALFPVLNKKLKLKIMESPVLALKIRRLNNVATKTDINRLVAIFRHYLAL